VIPALERFRQKDYKFKVKKKKKRINCLRQIKNKHKILFVWASKSDGH
jgi:phosphoserine aminotransferase